MPISANEYLWFLEHTPGGLFIFILAALCIGSFLNTVISRLPAMSGSRDRALALSHLRIEPSEPQTDNLFYPRSRCPHCYTAIKLHHLIPVISFVLLKGRCASCSKPISSRYLWVEIGTACLLLLVLQQFGLSISFLFHAVFVTALLALSVIDWEHRTLPDEITYPLTWLGLLFAAFWPEHATTSITQSVLGAIVGYLSLWGLNLLFQRLRGRDGMGYGDFKLVATIGAWMGAIDLLLVVVLAAIAGVLYALILMARGMYEKEGGIPFGPFLAIASMAMLFYPPLRAIV